MASYILVMYGAMYVYETLVLVMLVADARPLLARPSAIPDTLWNTAFSDRLDTATSSALMKIALDHWQFERDSVNKHVPFLLQRCEAYRDHGDERSVFHLEFTLGTLYKQVNDAPKSIQHFFAALSLADKLEEVEEVALINMEIGLIYYMQASWERAITFFRRSLSYYEFVGDTRRSTVRRYLIIIIEQSRSVHGITAAVSVDLPTIRRGGKHTSTPGDRNRTRQCATRRRTSRLRRAGVSAAVGDRQKEQRSEDGVLRHRLCRPCPRLLRR